MNKNIRQEEPNVSLKRHQAQCSVCSHPQCQQIEDEWTQWCSTTLLAERWRLTRFAIYRHVHARGLFRRRQENIKGYYESILERRDTASFSGANILAALKAYTELCAREEERKQAKSLPLRELFGRMSKPEREAFAQDGSLPPWLFAEPEPMPQDNLEGETDTPAEEDGEGSEGATALSSQDEQNRQNTSLQ